MPYIIVGLGNPSEEYEGTRHNAGASVVERFRESHGFPTWKEDKKLRAFIAKGEVGDESVMLILPQTFMNHSGSALKPLISSPKKAEKLVVVYDDLDLPLGNIRISFGRSSGGHRGLESVIKSIKMKDFMRLRIGTSPKTPGGVIKKPSGEEAVKNFVLAKFSPREIETFNHVLKRSCDALERIIRDGKERAMNEFNG